VGPFTRGPPRRRRTLDDLAHRTARDVDQLAQVVVADRQRGHEHHDVVERAGEDAELAHAPAHLEAGALEALDRVHLDAGHGADAADLAHAVVRGERLQPGAHQLADARGVRHRAALVHEREVRVRDRAAQRVGGVGVPVEERLGLARCAEERLVDLVGGEHRRERQVAGGDSLAAGEQVGAHVDVVDGPHAAGAAHAGGDLVDHHERAELVAQRAHALQERAVVREQTAGGLHEGLDDDRADLLALVLHDPAQLGQDLGRALGARLARCHQAGRRDGDGVEQDRPVGRVEEVDAADADRAERVAVVALGDVRVAGTLLPALRGGLERHLDRGLDGRRAVAREEHLGQVRRGARDQALGQLDARFVGAAEERRVVEPAQLVAHGLVELGDGVTVHVDPERGVAVEVAAAVDVPQVHALGPGRPPANGRAG
jgi:hypothetical protein